MVEPPGESSPLSSGSCGWRGGAAPAETALALFCGLLDAARMAADDTAALREVRGGEAAGGDRRAGGAAGLVGSMDKADKAMLHLVADAAARVEDAARLDPLLPEWLLRRWRPRT